MNRNWSTQLLRIWALSIALCGCTTVQFVELRERPQNPITERLTKTAFGQGPSVRTQNFLAKSAYSGGDDFARMILHCRSKVGTEQRLEALHAIAEISYLAAEAARQNDRALSIELCFDASRYSWLYLTTPAADGTLIDPNAATHRHATDIYNTSLQELLRLTRDSGDYQLCKPIRLPISHRILTMEIPHPTNWLTTDQLGKFEFVADYELKNLRNRHTKQGLGVPIMVRRRKTADVLEDYYEDGLSFPVTIVARFEQTSPDHAATLELYDPRDSNRFIVATGHLPLEADISTPLAWFLTDPKKSLLDTFAFFRTDKAQELEGLYMVQPYDPNRIPVLMVHGIWSSPITWMEMFNDLQSDPEIRSKYQFWFYMYPTGQPLTFAAAGLRDRLKELRLRCDPYGQNEKLDQMVVVGHSMGGLMSYLMTVDSEDKLWNALSRIPVNQIQANDQAHSEIQRVFFFESDRSIDRIVTIASPFNGSGYANMFTRWLGGSLVSLPNTTSELSQLIFRQNNQSVWDRMFAPRTSLDSLNKNSAILKLVSETTVPEGVKHHNIAGFKNNDTLKDGTDGVVKLRSAIRPNVDSEIKIKAAHSEVHRQPAAIAEVRRVLLEHLQELNSKAYPVRQLNHQQPPNSSGAVQLSP